MADTKKEIDGNESESRKPYAKPKLSEFGQVGALTQSGTLGMGEMGMGGKGMKAEERSRF